MFDTILFDLDGTLTDPKIGITTCVQYALKALGIIEEDLDKLEPFIGPPLKEQFIKYAGLSEEQAIYALEKYRERFQSTGLYENEIYEGIDGMLNKIKAEGITIGLASSKPTVFCKRILEYFHIEHYFTVIMGSELSGVRSQKAEVIEEALRQLGKQTEPEFKRVIMVGDREHDVFGAHRIGLPCVGVAFGYGGYEELKNAGADCIVATVEELTEVLIKKQLK